MLAPGRDGDAGKILFTKNATWSKPPFPKKERKIMPAAAFAPDVPDADAAAPPPVRQLRIGLGLAGPPSAEAIELAERTGERPFQ